MIFTQDSNLRMRIGRFNSQQLVSAAALTNKDLFRCNIINSPLCTCGKIEDEYHYFFTCPRYNVARNVLFNNIFSIDKLHIVNTHVLLWGDNSIIVFLKTNIYSQQYKHTSSRVADLINVNISVFLFLFPYYLQCSLFY